MHYVLGTPEGRALYGDELDLVIKAKGLEKQGLKVAVYVEPDDYGQKTVSSGSLFIEDPKVPGQHLQIDMMDGDYSEPRVAPGSLDRRVALEESRIKEQGRADAMPYGGRNELPRGSEARAYEEQISEAISSGSGSPKYRNMEVTSKMLANDIVNRRLQLIKGLLRN